MSLCTPDPFKTNFAAYVVTQNGTNYAQIAAMDQDLNIGVTNYQLVVTNNGVAETLSYDLNGNLTNRTSSTFTNSYEWDAENRLTAINEAGTNRSEFSYDGTGRRVEIVERNPTSLAILSDKRFVWCGTELCEERDSTGSTVTKRFFPKGEQISGTNYYFTQDHLGSAREMTDTSGTVRAEYDYDPYGQKTKLSGDAVADFGFTGHYNHLNSGLSFALYRGYNPNTGRWLNRDPIQEQGGLNLYDYGSDSPINRTDATGLSDRDLVVIMTAAHNIIDQMTKNGERVNPHYNDVWVWFSKHGQGCRDQALTVTAGLLKNKYDDTWHFSQVRVLHPSLIPIHQFIVAHSTNPNNATVIIDPYENEVMIINPGDQYVGLILNSDTITKGAGNGATTFTSKDF